MPRLAVGVANAIGASGPRNATSYADLFRNYSPLTLLQPGRLLALANSSEGTIRTEPFRPRFDVSETIRALQPPKITFESRRAWGVSQYQQVRVPRFHTTPVYRPYR